MQKDWVQHFKDRAATIITQPMDACEQVAALAPMLKDNPPESLKYPTITAEMSDEERRAAWGVIGMLAHHETLHLLARTMIKH
jgi:hypothetical protein